MSDGLLQMSWIRRNNFVPLSSSGGVVACGSWTHRLDLSIVYVQHLHPIIASQKCESRTQELRRYHLSLHRYILSSYRQRHYVLYHHLHRPSGHSRHYHYHLSGQLPRSEICLSICTALCWHMYIKFRGTYHSIQPLVAVTFELM